MTPPHDRAAPLLAEATALHRAGRLTEAHAAYARILAANPNELEAAYGVALIAIDLDRPAEAVPLLARCIAVHPQDVSYRIAFGLALLGKGDAEDAAAHFLDAANRAPRMMEPRLHLARALGAMKRWNQAAGVLSDAVNIFPGAAPLWAAKGNAERVLGRHEAAEASLRRALTLAPEDADILNNLSVVLRARGRTAEAISCYRQALALAPRSAVTHANLGNALRDTGQDALAEHHLRQSVALDPSAPDPRAILAIHLTRLERPDEAIPHFRRVLKTHPKHVDALTNLGVAELAVGNVAEAERYQRQAIALKKRNAEAHYNLAWILLLTGRWREGWDKYEWRWQMPQFSSRRREFSRPLWDGTARPEATLLLHAEQGLGDAIQFVRYAALARQRVGRVILECPRALVRLFRAVAGVDEVIATGTALPPFDVHAPLMTLPRIFETTLESVPGRTPYLRAPVEVAETLRLPMTTRPRIGLVWAGSPDNKIDQRRSIAAADFTPITRAVDVDFVSLQVGNRADEIDALPAANLVYTCEGRVKNFSETAAIVGQLDLVIGVDTAVVHLAAALGKPTWMLIPYLPDYRWLLERADSPWYSTLRLFCQPVRRDWKAVISLVCQALTNWQPSRV